MTASNWFVYIIRASDDSLYTGITVDVPRRFQDHSSGRGARYFRGRRPVAVVYLEGGFDRSGASRREAEIKRLSRAEKLALTAAYQPSDLSCEAALRRPSSQGGTTAQK